MKMRNITIGLPEIYIKALERMQESGVIPSRSEGIRISVRAFLFDELKLKEKIEVFIQ